MLICIGDGIRDSLIIVFQIILLGYSQTEFTKSAG